MKPTLKSEWFALTCILAALGITAMWYTDLPAQVPSHWNIYGQIDAYTTPLLHVCMFLGLMVIMYGLFLIIPAIEPRKENMAASMQFLTLVKNSMLAFFLLLYSCITYMAVYAAPLPIDKIIAAGIGLMFIALGNKMRTIQPNYFMGIRTPWTLHADSIWHQTHRLGSACFMLAGALFLVGILLPTPYNFAVPMAGVLLAVIVPIGYSYWLFRNK